MYCVYELDNYDYVSVHQNHIICSLREEFAYFDDLENSSNLIKRCIINQPIINDLIDFILSREKRRDILIWDARKMIFKPIHYLERLSLLLGDNSYKRIIFIHDDSDLSQLVNTQLSSLDQNIKIQKFCDEHWFCERGDKHLPYWKEPANYNIMIDRSINYLLFKHLDSLEYPKYLPVKSSNVYANRYINVKNLFCNRQIMQLVTYRLACVLTKHLEQIKGDFDAFLCASLNGACLASALSVIYKKPVVFLRNVGPHMTTNDERMVDRIDLGKKYIFVFDFMCMGTEYQRTKMLCNIKRAIIKCSIGVSHYKYPMLDEENIQYGEEYVLNRKLQILALFHINSFQKNYYCCVVEKPNSEASKS